MDLVSAVIYLVYNLCIWLKVRFKFYVFSWLKPNFKFYTCTILDIQYSTVSNTKQIGMKLVPGTFPFPKNEVPSMEIICNNG